MFRIQCFTPKNDNNLSTKDKIFEADRFQLNLKRFKICHQEAWDMWMLCNQAIDATMSHRKFIISFCGFLQPLESDK